MNVPKIFITRGDDGGLKVELERVQRQGSLNFEQDRLLVVETTPLGVSYLAEPAAWSVDGILDMLPALDVQPFPISFAASQLIKGGHDPKSRLFWAIIGCFSCTRQTGHNRIQKTIEGGYAQEFGARGVEAYRIFLELGGHPFAFIPFENSNTIGDIDDGDIFLDE